MRIAIHLLLYVALWLPLQLYSQSITLKGNNLKLEEVLTAIKKQTGVQPLYESSILKQAHRVNINVAKAPLQHTLSICFAGQPLKYRLFGSTLVISEKDLPAHNIPIRSAPIILKGKVVNESGEPLENVVVTVSKSRQSTLTDSTGAFVLLNIQPGTLLQFSAINAESVELTVNEKTGLVVALPAKVTALPDVEVIADGYKTQLKTKTPGSVVLINTALLNRSPGPNIIDRLTNITSGVSGLPGTIPQVRINSTINANRHPLIVVDGFAYDQGEQLGLFNRLNMINPNDIESITVLKDAAAASIWGVRAGNGVLVITHKKGRYRQKMSVQFNSNITIGAKPNLKDIPVLSASDYLELEQHYFAKGWYNGLLHNRSNYPAVSQGIEIMDLRRRGLISSADSASRWNALQHTNVLDDISRYFLQHSINQQYALNISGGTDKLNYYASIGYDNNKANAVGETWRRLTLRMENNFKPFKDLEISGFLNYTQVNDNSSGIAWYNLLPANNKIAPYSRLLDNNGNAAALPKQYRLSYIDTVQFAGMLPWQFRPLEELQYGSNRLRQYTMRLGATVKYYLFTGLTAEVKYQYEQSPASLKNIQRENLFYTRDLINQYQHPDTAGNIVYPIPRGSILEKQNVDLRSWNIRAQLNYRYSHSNHDLVALAGYEARELLSDIENTRLYGYDEQTGSYATNIDYSRWYNLRPIGIGRIPEVNNTAGSQHRYRSYYANGIYTYQQKYTLSISGRIDGSNFFGIKANRRATPLWSTGVGWNIAKEKFYKTTWLPQLTVRVSYGFCGNTNNNASAWPVIDFGTSNLYINAPYASVVSPPNPSLRWEKVRILNLALDFSLYKQWITGSIEYYTKKGTDLISQVLIDPTTGALTPLGTASYIGNNAAINGSGIDIILNTTLPGKRFKWESVMLLSHATDKVIKYEQSPSVNNLLNMPGTPRMGYSLNSLYAYQWAGLDPSNGDPRGYLDGKVTNYANFSNGAPVKLTDLVARRAIPAWFGSFRNTLHYKRWSLSVNVVMKLDYYFRRSSVNYYGMFVNWGGHTDYTKRWQKPGDEQYTNVPSLPSAITTGRDFFYQYADVLLEKADHIRLQDIRLDYTFSDTRKKPLWKEARLFVYINNVGIIWRANQYKIDPDYTDGMTGILPPPVAFTFGTTVNF